MAKGAIFSSSIELGGKVSSTLLSAFSKATSGLSKIGETGKKATSELSKGFKSAEGAAHGLLTKIAGLGVALIGIKSATDFWTQAIDTFREEGIAKSTNALMAALMNMPSVAKRGSAAIQEQKEAFTELAESMQKATGIDAANWLSGMSKMAAFGGHAEAAKKLSLGIEDLALQTGDTSKEGIADVFTKVSAAIKSGAVGKFRKELGLTTEQVKAFKKETNLDKRITIMEGFLEGKAGHSLEMWQKSSKFRLAQAQTERKELLNTYGGLFNELDIGWTTLTTKTSSAFMSMFGDPSNAIGGVKNAFQTAGSLVDVFKSKISSLGIDTGFQSLFGHISKRLFGGLDFGKLFKQVENPATGDMMTILTPEGDAKFNQAADFIKNGLKKVESAFDFIDKNRKLAEAGIISFFALKSPAGSILLSSLKGVSQALGEIVTKRLLLQSLDSATSTASAGGGLSRALGFTGLGAGVLGTLWLADQMPKLKADQGIKPTDIENNKNKAGSSWDTLDKQKRRQGIGNYLPQKTSQNTTISPNVNYSPTVNVTVQKQQDVNGAVKSALDKNNEDFLKKLDRANSDSSRAAVT